MSSQVLKCLCCGAPLVSMGAKCEYCGTLSKAAEPTLGEAASTFGKTLTNTISSTMTNAFNRPQGNTTYPYQAPPPPPPPPPPYYPPRSTPKKSKILALLLALFFGFFGVHRFYIGDKASIRIAFGFIIGLIMVTTLSGVTKGTISIVYFIFWVVDFIQVCMMSEERLNRKYNERK